MWIKGRRVFNAEGGDAGGGGGAQAGGAGGADGGKEGAAAGGAQGDKAGEKSLLEQLGSGGDGGGAAAGGGDDKGAAPLTEEQKALAAAEKDTRRPQHVPSKFWDSTKGEVKYEAWAKSTNELETRMRVTGLPPKSAEEYKFDLPEPVKALGVDLDPAQAKAFRENAMTLGLTQKQYEGVMGAYFQHMSGLADQVSQFSAAKARTDLLAYYKTEDALKENVGAAYKAFMAYADEKDRELIDQVGNIPAVVRILAKVHRDMREDPGVGADAILDADSIEQLMRGGPDKEDSPYWNPSDPRHKSTVEKVRRHHEAQARARQRKAA